MGGAMETRFRAWLPLALAGALALLLAACAGGAPEGTPTKPPITIGATYDATGATANVGVPLKTGWEDYINLVNSKGGVDGHPINLINIEHGYEVPKGVGAYEQVKRQGAVMFLA